MAKSPVILPRMRQFLSSLLLALSGLQLASAPTNTVLEVKELAWFYGRNYFVLRSGPRLFPGSPPVTADLRFRRGRLQIQITGKGNVKRVTYNGQSLRFLRGRVTLPAAGSLH
jgi:hypothetical protein